MKIIKTISYKDAILYYDGLMHCDIVESNYRFNFSFITKIYYNMMQLSEVIQQYEIQRKDLESEYDEDTDGYEEKNKLLLNDETTIEICLIDINEAISLRFSYDTISKLYFMVDLDTVVL